MKIKHAKMQLENFFILHSNFSENTNAKTSNIFVDVDFDPLYNKKDKDLFGMKFILKINENKKDIRLQASLDLLGIFRFDKDLDKKQKEKLFLFNGPAILLGVARGIVMEKVSTMDPNSCILPVLDLTDLINEKKKSFSKKESKNEEN